MLNSSYYHWQIQQIHLCVELYKFIFRLSEKRYVIYYKYSHGNFCTISILLQFWHSTATIYDILHFYLFITVCFTANVLLFWNCLHSKVVLIIFYVQMNTLYCCCTCNKLRLSRFVWCSLLCLDILLVEVNIPWRN